MRITYINSSTDLKNVHFLSKCARDTHTINHDRQLLAGPAISVIEICAYPITAY